MGGVTGTLYFRTTKHIKPYDFISIDVETYGEENIFYMGGIYDKNGYRVFYNRQHMINELLKYKSHTYIIATNLQFDFNAIFFGTNLYSEFKIIMRGSDFISCIYTNEKGKNIRFVDTFNYAPFSVATMGDILGIPKLPSPKFLGEKPITREEIDELRIYNERDCEVTYRFSQLLQTGFNELGGNMKLTIASTSLDIWLRKYLRFNLFKENIKNFDVNAFIFEAYAGGRTEVFNRGLYETKPNAKLRCFDANSLYPFVMQSAYPLPNSAKHTFHPTMDILKYMGISKCIVDVPKETLYPILWKRYKGKLLFPTGKFSGTFTHEEIKRAMQDGVKVELIETLYYTKIFYPFREYIFDLYNKRMEYKHAKNPLEICSKLSMNSLYGKMAQREQSQFEFFDMHTANEKAIKIWIGKEKVFFNPKDEIGYSVEIEECSSSFVTPILACYTTAKARLHMYEYIIDYDALYTDTDSLWTYEDLPVSDKIGAMKVEYDAESVIFVKPKMYIVKLLDGNDKIKLKGVPRANREQFESILKGDSVTYMKFSKTKSSLRQKKRPNTKEMIKKNISLEDNKRTWEYLFDGSAQTSNPIHLDGVDFI